MNPLELIGWALAASAAIVIVGITIGMVVAINRGLSNRAKNL